MLRTFRAKLLALVAMTALALVSMTIASEVVARRVEQHIETVQQRYLPRLLLRADLDATFERLRRGFQDAAAAQDLDAVEATRDVKKHFLEAAASAPGAVDPADGRALRDAFEDYDAAARDVTKRLISGETGEALVGAIASMQAKQVRVTDALEKATALRGEDLARAFAEASQAELLARQSRLVIGVACLVAALAFSLTLGRSLVRSVDALTAGLRRFGEGRFEPRIATGARDELGDLAQHANQMAENLERASRERSEAEKRFRDLLELAPDAMVIVGADGRIALVNAQVENVFGFSRHELVGRDVALLMPARFRGPHAKHVVSYFESPSARRMGPGLELFGARKDGTEFPIEVSLSPLETTEGTLVSAAIRDVTERRRIENALKASNRELEAFSYSVAHDLRAPLRGLNGFASALLEDASENLDETSKDYLGRIKAGADRMGVLIDALLSLARVSRAQVARESVALTKLAEAVAQQLQKDEPDRRVTFDLQDDVTAMGDPGLLRALFDNLIGNAWKFTKNNAAARIAFGAEAKGATVAYFVKDNGAGFDMAFADKLFAPFQRLHSTREFAGTGIGLATVQRIVRRHGGEIWAEGVVGQGATFHFTLGGGTARGGEAS